MEEPPAGELSWSMVAARGRSKVTVPHSLNRKDSHGVNERLEHVVIYETPDIQQKWLTQRAAAILQNTLRPDTVVFEFQAKDFAHHTDAYKLLVQKLGPLEGNGARPISRFGNSNRPELIIEVKFEEDATNVKAVTEGFTHNGVVHTVRLFHRK